MTSLKTLPLLNGVPYETLWRITDSVSVVFHDAGHILGSAMLEVVVAENGSTRRVIFSGDIGQWHKPIIRDPSLFDSADYVVMESTYGDRNHEERRRRRNAAVRCDQRNHRPRRQRRHPDVRRRAGPRVDVLHQPAGPRRPHSRCEGVPRQPDGRRRDEHLSEVSRVLRSGSLGADRLESVAAAVPGTATRANRGSIEGDQQRAEAVHHHGDLGNVYGRPHQASSAPQHFAAGVHDPVCRLSSLLERWAG